MNDEKWIGYSNVQQKRLWFSKKRILYYELLPFNQNFKFDKYLN